MLSRILTVALAALLFVIALEAVGLSASQTPSYEECRRAEYAKASNQAEKEAQKGFSRAHVRCVAFSLDQNNGLITAIATVVMALFTGTLWLVTGRSVALAREEFNATHRPRVGIRGIHSLTKDNVGFTNIVYVNRGIGEAKITAIGCALILGEFIREAPAFEMQKILPHRLKSGDSESHNFWSERTSIEYVFGAGFHYQSDPRKTPSNAFLVGIITYEDSMGRCRETGFCRKNAPGTDLWEVVKDSGYEYED
jgi:hypothetical protein